jgi:hypothetical protein
MEIVLLILMIACAGAMSFFYGEEAVRRWKKQRQKR